MQRFTFNSVFKGRVFGLSALSAIGYLGYLTTLPWRQTALWQNADIFDSQKLQRLGSRLNSFGHITCAFVSGI